MCAICPNVRVQQDAELPERAMEREGGERERENEYVLNING